MRYSPTVEVLIGAVHAYDDSVREFGNASDQALRAKRALDVLAASVGDALGEDPIEPTETLRSMTDRRRAEQARRALG